MLGRYTTVPTELLLNPELSAVEKLVAVTIVGNTDIEGNTTVTVDDLVEVIKRTHDGKVMVPNKKSVEELFSKITKLLKVDVVKESKPNKTPKKEEKIDTALEAKVDEVMDFVSQARLVRGYSTRALTGDTHRRLIRGRLREGVTVDECKAFAVYKFQQDWNKKNDKTLVPSIMFNRTKFQRDIANINLEDWMNKEITKYGYEDAGSSESTTDEPLAVM